MHAIVWIIIALAVAAIWSSVAIRRTQRMLSAPSAAAGEALPSTPMQRAATLALIPTVVLAIAASAMVVNHGVLAMWENDTARVTATVLLIGALAGYTYFIARVRTWLIRDNDTLDERDRAILASVPSGQAPAMMVTMAAWMIYLTESFRATHLVPSAYLYAIFWSLLLVSIIASLLGVLIGYRRS